MMPESFHYVKVREKQRYWLPHQTKLLRKLSLLISGFLRSSRRSRIFSCLWSMSFKFNSHCCFHARCVMLPVSRT